MRAALPALLLLLGLTGCADAQRPLPVSAAAIDGTHGAYTMTAELIRQESLDGDAAPVYLTAEGADFDALFADADRKLGGQFYFSHAETVVLGEDTACEGIGPLADFLAARQDARLTLRLAVARDAAAAQLLRMDALGETIPGVALGDLLDGLAQRGQLPDAPLYRVRDALLTEEELMLPCLIPTEDGHADAHGLALLRQGRLARCIPAEEVLP